MACRRRSTKRCRRSPPRPRGLAPPPERCLSRSSSRRSKRAALARQRRDSRAGHRCEMLAKLGLLLALCSGIAYADDDPPSTAPGNTPPADPAPPPPPLRRTPTGTFQIGVGYATDDGFGASASVTQSDLFGTGKLLSLDAMLDEREQRFQARFVDPELFGSEFQLAARAIADDKHLDGFTRQAAGITLEHSHLVGPHAKWFVGYRLAPVTAEPDATPTAPGADVYDVAALRIGTEYNTLDHPFLATRGSRIGSMIEVGTPSLGSDISFLHTKAYAETHQRLGAFILHLSGSLENVSGNSLPHGEQVRARGARAPGHQARRPLRHGVR